MLTAVSASIDDSDAMVTGDISVLASSDTRVREARAIGVSVSASLAPAGFALAVAASDVNNTIRGTVDAHIASTGANFVAAGGDITVSADVVHAKIKDIEARVIKPDNTIDGNNEVMIAI